ncbi:MAG: GNAT family N-acetyltransferase [Candidatus Aquicultor sp.]|nr:GNAT family N-acetyltransferase [Candidatus Aquicultor sp.]
MDLKLELVSAAREDMPTLAGFLCELFKLEEDFEPDAERQAAALELILANPGYATVYIVRVGGETAGMVALHLAISTAEGGWCGRIEDVYLKPEFRRLGIGSRVLEELRALAAERGLTRLMLVADKDNTAALKFYAACGFSEMNLVSLIQRISKSQRISE